MKTYNVSKRTSKQAKNEINRIIETNNKYKSCYFWQPSINAAGRRANESKFITNNPEICFLSGEDEIICKMVYNETCKNVYYKMEITVNGEKKNITTLKNLLK